MFALMLSWGLPEDELRYVLREAISLRELRPRETLYAQGSKVTHIYLIKSGTVYQDRLTNGAGREPRISLRREVGAGHLVGQYDMLFGKGHSTRVRALDFAQVIQVDAGAVNRLLYQHPELRNKIAPATVIGRLRTVPFFAGLDTTTLSLLGELCEGVDVHNGEKIYSAGDNAAHIFVIDKGQVVLTPPSRREYWLGNGMVAGILNRILDNPLLAEPLPYGHDAASIGHTELFRWDREAIVKVTGIHPERRGHRLRVAVENALRRVDVFREFPIEQQRKLVGYMSHYYFPIHHIVMQQGENGDSMWVLMPRSTGTLRALDGTRALQPTTVQGPTFFSELSLEVEYPLYSTVQADPGSQWLRLHKEDYQAFLLDTGSGKKGAVTLTPATEQYLGQSRQRKRHPWLQFNERLLAFRRRHWVYLIKKMLLPTLLVTLLLLSFAGVAYMGWLQTWQWGLWTAAAVIAGGFFLWRLVDYLNDYILVTNQRIVHQEKVLFMAEWYKDAFLETIRNVDVKTSFFGRLLNYGIIDVQTAATEGSIAFDYVPKPHALKELVLEQQAARVRQHSAAGKLVIQNLLEERLGLELDLPSRVSGANNGDIKVSQSWRAMLAEWREALFGPRNVMQDKLIWRKHWLVLLGKIIAPLALIIFILMVVTGQRIIPESLHNLVTALDMALALVSMAAVAVMLWNIADWRNDTYEVDYSQLADVAKKPLFFSEDRRTALLSEIENVDFSIPSPIHYLFNFGNVRIQTAATEGDFSFDWVPSPRSVAGEINRRREIYRQRQEEQRARQRTAELPDWFEMYDRLGADARRESRGAS